jgi:hypothetical protein
LAFGIEIVEDPFQRGVRRPDVVAIL